MNLYVASSWRNAHYLDVLERLRERGFTCYDFRNPPEGPGFAWSAIDPAWESWTTKQYREALRHPVAERGFTNDFRGMVRAEACVLVLPCGRSAHLEAGWFMGQGRPVAVLVPKGVQIEPELMYLLGVGGASSICTSVAEVEGHLRFHQARMR